MTIPVVLDLARDFLTTAMMISMPALIVSLVLGVLVGVLQTITSVQEQTLSFVPRLIAVGVVMLVCLGWILTARRPFHDADAGMRRGGRPLIDTMVMTWALTLARVGTFVHFLPLLGGPNVPRMVKVGLSMALAVFFYGDAAAGLAGADGVAQVGSVSWLIFFLALGREMLLGGILGFALNLFLVPARVAGEFVAQESGLTFANVLTATGENTGNPFTALFEMLAAVAFFSLDLHHVFLQLLHETFRHYPIGAAYGLPRWDLVRAASAAEEGGLLLAAPMALCLILTTVIMMLMSRAAPQLNLFSVGFPLRVIVSLAAIVLLLPPMMTALVGQFASLIDLLKLG